MVKQGGTLHRGNYKVTNGYFDAEFVVPKDIAYTNETGRLFVYARSEKDEHARGSSTAFVVGGIDTISHNDTEGPSVRLYLDSPSFLPGDVVRKNPLLLVHLKDETGINSTGLGVGHKIEAWVDDGGESLDLSDYYVSSLTSSREGVATRQLFDLTPGLHSVRVRVWDVLNNYSEASTFFSVGANDSSLISGRVLVFPNPFSTQTTILFTHNQSLPVTATASIYSVTGVKLRSFELRITSLQNGSFVWDGCDEQGNRLSAGIYPVEIGRAHV